MLTDMVRSWLDAHRNCDPLTTEASDERQDHRTAPAQASVCVHTPVNSGSGASSSGEHAAPVRASGAGVGTGMERECDPGARSGPGPLGTDGRSGGLQDPGGGRVDGTGGSGVCPGGVATGPLQRRLAPAATTLRVHRHTGHRCRRLLQPCRLQRRAIARPQGHHGASRTALLARPPPGRQAEQGQAG